MSGLIGRLRKDRRGVSGIEFAAIAPFLIAVYVGSVELTMGLSIDKKVSRAASSIGDILALTGQVDEELLQTKLAIAESIMSPFGHSEVKIKLTGIEVDDSGVAKVAWSWDENNARPYAVGTDAGVPDELTENEGFFVRTELSYDHTLSMLMFSGLDIRNITLNKVQYHSPRASRTVMCTDC